MIISGKRREEDQGAAGSYVGSPGSRKTVRQRTVRNREPSILLLNTLIVEACEAGMGVCCIHIDALNGRRCLVVALGGRGRGPRHIWLPAAGACVFVAGVEIRPGSGIWSSYGSLVMMCRSGHVVTARRGERFPDRVQLQESLRRFRVFGTVRGRRVRRESRQGNHPCARCLFPRSMTLIPDI